jgi:hypothetical protein
MEAICAYCKTFFIPKRIDARYCSHSCRQLAYVLRKALVHDKKESTPENELSIKKQEWENDSLIKHETKGQISNLWDSELTDTKKELSNLTDQQNYRDLESPFIREIMELSEQRDYTSHLTILFQQGDVSVTWISLRYKCLLECVLLFSEMQYIQLDDLKEVCNAFTSIIQSRFYRGLPQSYPYITEIIELRNHVKEACLSVEEEDVLKFKLKRETKQKLIASRWELSGRVPKRTFNQLNFKE